MTTCMKAEVLMYIMSEYLPEMVCLQGSD